ncbi:MAG: IS1634 family transposase, partial [Nocardioidaceae bacterium]
TAEGMEAAIDGAAAVPERTWHLPFGDVAAVWKVLAELDIAGLVDSVVGASRGRVSVGTYLALAVLHRVTAPDDPLDLAAWWSRTAAQRFVRPRPQQNDLHHRKFWRCTERLTQPRIERIEAALHRKLLRGFPAGAPVLAVDLPDFATYVDGATGDARLAGLCLLITLDGAVPLLSHGYQYGRSPQPAGDAVERLIARHRTLAGTCPVTVIADTAQAVTASTGSLSDTHLVAPLPLGDHPALLGATARRPVDHRRLPGVTALDTRTRVTGSDRRVVVVHSRNLQAAQDRTLVQDLSHATRRLAGLDSALRTRSWLPSRDEAAAEVARTARFRWSEQVLSTTLDGTAPGGLRLHWAVDETAQARLRHELFGKQLIATDQDEWTVAQVITAYRTRYHLTSTLRHRSGAMVTAPVERWRWTEPRVAVHALISVLAATAMHLMRRTAEHAGLHLSVRELLDQLAGIQETHLRYTSTGGRPPTRRILTERDALQQRLFELFELHRYAP